MKKFLLIVFVVIPVIFAVLVTLLVSPIAKSYVNEHGHELIGRKINVDGVSINVFTGNVALKDMTIFEANGDSVFANADGVDVNLSMIDLLQKKIHLEGLSINNPKMNIVQKDTVFNFDDILLFFSEGEESSDEIVIDEFKLKGGEVNYIDKTEPSVPFPYKLHKLKVTAKDFTTTGYNHLELSSKLGEFGEMEAIYDGKLTDSNNCNLNFSLKELDLTDFTPLFLCMFGREVLSGKLNLDSEITIINGKIDGQNHVEIISPKVEKVKGLSFKPEYRKIPLKSVLYIMTDKKGVCELDLPISGTKDDPKFTYKRALMKMFGKAALKVVTSPFSKIGKNDE